eukprot:668992-Pelagomonas_calceolata.AAC.2
MVGLRVRPGAAWGRWRARRGPGVHGRGCGGMHCSLYNRGGVLRECMVWHTAPDGRSLRAGCFRQGACGCLLRLWSGRLIMAKWRLPWDRGDQGCCRWRVWRVGGGGADGDI